MPDETLAPPPPTVDRCSRTDLYHNHAKGECICFSRDRIGPLDDLWCGPPCGISLRLSCMDGADSVGDRGKSKIRQTSVAVVVNENVWLAGS